MKIRIILIPVCLFVLLILSCGALPPTEDLNQAKAALARAEEAKAEDFASSEYQTASEGIGEAEGMIVPGKKSKANVEAQAKLEEAKAEAEIAYKKAAPAYAQFNIEEAEKAGGKAEDIKARVAVKEKFEEAQDLLTQAEKEKSSGNYKTAWESAIKAKGLFDEVYQITLEKKQAAEQALGTAESAIETAEEKDK